MFSLSLSPVLLYILLKKTRHIIFESLKGSVVYLSGKLSLQIGFESDMVLAYKTDIKSALITKYHKLLRHGNRIKTLILLI